MSQIDCFKYYHIGTLLDLPIYIPRYDFNYLERDINPSTIIWGDDCGSMPIFLNLRKVMWNFFLWCPDVPDDDYMLLCKKINKNSYLDKVSAWNESYYDDTYESHYEDVKKFMKIKKKDKKIDPLMNYQNFIGNEMAYFIIKNYPQLLTDEERECLSLYKIKKRSGYVQKVELRSEGLSSSPCTLTLV